MPGEVPILPITLVAASDLSAKQYYAIAVDSNSKAALAGAGADAPAILQNKPESGRDAELMFQGISLGQLGGTVASGGNVMVNSSGKFVAADGTGAVVGKCLMGGVSGENRPIFLSPRNHDGLYAADTASTDDYVITLAPAPPAYYTGMTVTFKAATANTGACTVNVNGLGAKALKRGVSTDPGDNFIKVGSIVVAVYDGTNFQMIQPAAQ